MTSGGDKPEKPDEAVPTVTVLSGFLGSGKTTLLNHMLSNTEGKKIAVVVNDLGDVNIDANMIKKKGHLQGDVEKMVELTNGCICCLKDDMVEEVGKLARGNRVDHIVIESTGIGEPLPVAAAFDTGVPSDSGKLLKEIARLDTMVTVVDLATFEKFLGTGEAIGEAVDFPNQDVIQGIKKKQAEEAEKFAQEHQHPHPHPPADAQDEAMAPPPEAGGCCASKPGDDLTKTVSSLLTDQVEFADRIILNKRDLVNEEDVTRVRGIVSQLNPHAEIMVSERGKIDLTKVLATGAFDFARAKRFAKWAHEIDENKVVPQSMAADYGISSFTYRATKPFHPHRFYDLFEQKVLYGKGVVRMKGCAWIPSEQDLVFMIQAAGPSFSFDLSGAWFAAFPEENFDQMLKDNNITLEGLRAMNPHWDNPRIRDRKSEIVVIGVKMNKAEVRKLLDASLVTDEEWPESMPYAEFCQKVFED